MKKKRRASDIQSVIMTVLSLMTVITSISMGLLLYNRYETAMRQNDVRDAQNMMETIVNSMEQYLKSMRQISDTANYNIIQALDISSPEFNQELSLLYDSNKDKIQSIALYDMEGELLVAEPVTLQKEGVEVSRQSWFENAKAKIENMHFSTPHMQDLFQDDAKRYHWVISLSRAVDVIDGDSPENGILLVDMKYSFIEEMMDRINDRTRGRYYYLCDREGKLIYHPYANEISNGLFQENSVLASSSEDGIYRNLRSPHGERQTMIVNTISYTGWKLVGVVLPDIRTDSLEKFRIYMMIIVIMLIMMLLAVNRIVSKKISSPILKLDASVTAYEAGEKPDIYIGGSYEIRHLGNSVQKSYEDRNYMNIQKYRYKERFVTEYDVSEEIYPFCTVKLILQPILENAIYYGVGDMDEDDHPRILVRGFKKEEEIYLVVSDNGMGMRREDVENILTDNQKVPKHGSGVGLINVHTRIQLMFGVRYGLTVESEPDEGTTVTIHLPAIPYTKENCEILEAPGKPPRNEVEP